MEIIQRKVKMPKQKLYKQVHNNNGLNIRLFGAQKLVGFFIITKELTNDYQGYMGVCIHEEYKSGALQTLIFSEKKK